MSNKTAVYVISQSRRVGEALSGVLEEWFDIRLIIASGSSIQQPDSNPSRNGSPLVLVDLSTFHNRPSRVIELIDEVFPGSKRLYLHPYAEAAMIDSLPAGKANQFLHISAKIEEIKDALLRLNVD